MSSSIPLQIAETIQTASIKKHPDVRHDLNPSTAASQKQPVTVSHHHDEVDDYDEVDSAASEDDAESDIPYDVIRPVPRRPSMPPLPDLRFEQSYLASIANADTKWRVAYITIRDQVIFPLVQGTLWSLALEGWKFWNRTAQLSGTSVGSRVRRWWYGVNNWSMEDVKAKVADKRYAAQVAEYYQDVGGAGEFGG